MNMTCFSKLNYLLSRRRRKRRLLLALALYFHVTRNIRIRRQDRYWVHSIITRRRVYGAHNHLMCDLELDGEQFVSYFRLFKQQFEYVHNVIKDDIVKQNVSRETISPRHLLFCYIYLRLDLYNILKFLNILHGK